MARPRRQDARRGEIVTAATVAIADRGLAGLRIKDIADAAGLSQGSVAYYYPEMNDLLLAVHEAAVKRFYDDARASIADRADPVEKIRVLVRLGICEPGDPLAATLYELHLHGAREPDHADLMSRLFENEASLYRGVIDEGVASGAFDIDVDSLEIAYATVAFEDGCGLHIHGRNRNVDLEWGRAATLRFLADALSCDELAV